MHYLASKRGVVFVLAIVFMFVLTSDALYSQGYSKVGKPKIREKDPCDDFEIWSYFDPPRKISLAEYDIVFDIINRDIGQFYAYKKGDNTVVISFPLELSVIGIFASKVGSLTGRCLQKPIQLEEGNFRLPTSIPPGYTTCSLVLKFKEKYYLLGNRNFK